MTVKISFYALHGVGVNLNPQNAKRKKKPQNAAKTSQMLTIERVLVSISFVVLH